MTALPSETGRISPSAFTVATVGSEEIPLGLLVPVLLNAVNGRFR